MKKVLVIAAHRKDRAPNQRFRFEQYVDFLGSQGFEIYVSPLISQKDDMVFYRKGYFLAKLFILLKAAGRRLRDVLGVRRYDLVLICREAFLTGTTFFEKMIHRSGVPVIYDFDDAIWHFDVSAANRNFGWMKNPGKTARLISIADMVFAGNRYLADYALHHNKSVAIVPTTIDTAEYVPVPFRESSPLCIGWSGSITTIRHFEMAVPVLKTIKEKFGAGVVFKVIGDGNYVNEKLGIRGIPWNKESELQELSGIDIGIMPLPDDEWAKGKCGLKGLQYMALGIATVMSPVGVNTEIIRDGENGMLANSDEEWIEKLSLLIGNPELRQKCGRAGRETVEKSYSVDAVKWKYLEHFKALTSGKND